MYHPHAGDVFQQYGAHFVQQLLELPEQGRCASHNKIGNPDNQPQHPQQYDPHQPILHKGQKKGHDKNHRHRQQHLKQAHHRQLNGGHIGYHPGGHGCGAEGLKVKNRQLERFFIYGLTEIRSHLGRQSGAYIASDDCGDSSDHRSNEHFCAGIQKSLKACGSRGALVQHFGGIGGNQHHPHHIHGHQQGRKNAQLPMGL